MGTGLEEGVVTNSTFLQYFEILFDLTTVFNDSFLSLVCLSVPPRTCCFHLFEAFPVLTLFFKKKKSGLCVSRDAGKPIATVIDPWPGSTQGLWLHGEQPH